MPEIRSQRFMLLLNFLEHIATRRISVHGYLPPTGGPKDRAFQRGEDSKQSLGNNRRDLSISSPDKCLRSKTRCQLCDVPIYQFAFSG